MKFNIKFTDNSNDKLLTLENSKDKKNVCKAVHKTLALMENNIKHQSLNTHKYNAFTGPNGEDVFESYAQNNTPGAYRIFWCYGPSKGQITILDICPHP